MKHTRRAFVSNAGKVVAASGIAALPASKPLLKEEKNLFVHHVYFWLKNAGSAADKAKLLEGLQKLSKVKTIQLVHIGQPADTNREVIDRSYALSWLCFFKSKADQDSYQVDPIHLDFIENYSPLWSKVIVYDSVDAK